MKNDQTPISAYKYLRIGIDNSYKMTSDLPVKLSQALDLQFLSQNNF